jgi:ribosomal protein S5
MGISRKIDRPNRAEDTVSIGRVTKVVKGSRVSFSALVVIGDGTAWSASGSARRGSAVGHQEAIEAQKALIRVPMAGVIHIQCWGSAQARAAEAGPTARASSPEARCARWWSQPGFTTC